MAWLADHWARARGGRLLALVVDHGLRPESAPEAAATVAQLRARGVAARLLPLQLAGGPAVQARARAARLRALLAACAAAGTPWLLLGQHRGDQAETLLHRALRGSGSVGLAGMAAARPAAEALILRPLLTVPAARLEATVALAGLRPVRDPGNADPRQTRARLRSALGDAPGSAAAIAALNAGADALACRRDTATAAIATRLAAAARLHAAGWCELDLRAFGQDAVAAAALGALLRAIGGGAFAPGQAAVAALLARGEGTLGGAWLRPGPRGRHRLLREPGAVAGPVPALAGACWDGRFRLTGPGDAGCTLGALGPAPAIARAHRLPAAVVATMPAIRRGELLLAVPPLAHPDPVACAPFELVFAPAAGPVGRG